eukprot:8277777-Alexandrium_andersonii.AAC.1
MAKRDIEAAFRLIWVAPEDVEVFAGDLPWEPSRFLPESARPDRGAEQSWQAADAWLKECTGLSGAEEWAALLSRGLAALLLVLTFGWSSSPGEWTPWALATLHYHRGPRRDGPEAFRAQMLMDDAVLVEPDIGNRPALSAA